MKHKNPADLVPGLTSPAGPCAPPCASPAATCPEDPCERVYFPFSQDKDGLVPGPTSSEVSQAFILGADGKWGPRAGFGLDSVARSMATSVGIVESADFSVASSENLSQSVLMSASESKLDSAILSGGADSAARSAISSAVLVESNDASASVSRDISQSTLISDAASTAASAGAAAAAPANDSIARSAVSSAVLLGSGANSVAESNNLSQSILISAAQSTASVPANDSEARSGVSSAVLLGSGVNSVAESNNLSQSILISAAQSTANAAGGAGVDSVARSGVSSAVLLGSGASSVATSQDISQSILISAAQSTATAAGGASTDSIARSMATSVAIVEASDNLSQSVLISVNGSQNTSQSVLISVAQSTASANTGSGTVNAGLLGQLAYYAAAGTVVSGSPIASLSAAGLAVTGAIAATGLMSAGLPGFQYLEGGAWAESSFTNRGSYLTQSATVNPGFIALSLSGLPSQAVFVGSGARGTLAAVAPTQSNDGLVILMRSYGTSWGNSARIDMLASETHSAATRGSFISLSVTASGSVSPVEVARFAPTGLTVTGSVGITQNLGVTAQATIGNLSNDYAGQGVFFIRGITKGVRIYTVPTGTQIEGVDSATGVTSYQPLGFGGSALFFQIQAANIMTVGAAGVVVTGTVSTTSNIVIGNTNDFFNGSLRISDNAASTASAYFQSGEPGVSGTNVIISNNYYGVSGGGSGRKNTAAGGAFIRLNGSTPEVNFGLITAAGAISGPLTINNAGIGVNGNVNVSGGVYVQGGTFAQGAFYYSASLGTVIGAKTGSTFDFSVYDPAGANQLIGVETGSRTVVFSGLHKSLTTGFTVRGDLIAYSGANDRVKAWSTGAVSQIQFGSPTEGVSGWRYNRGTGAMVGFVGLEATPVNVMTIDSTGASVSGIFTATNIVRASDGTRTLSMVVSGGALYFGSQTNHQIILIVNGGQVGVMHGNGLDGCTIGYTTPQPGNFTTITSTGIAVTGAITATGDITAFFSDDRLKTRLGNITDALAKVCSLDGFFYEPNEVAQRLGYQPVRTVGLSAQSVQKILPEVVAPAPIASQYLTIKYDKIIPLLVEAIKELNAKFDAYKLAHP